MINVNLLRLFVKVAETESIAGAARLLDWARSTVDGYAELADKSMESILPARPVRPRRSLAKPVTERHLLLAAFVWPAGR
jgi:hypothetical protein